MAGPLVPPRGLRGLRALPRGRAVHVYRAHDVSVDGGARSRGFAQQRAASGGEERGECRAFWIFSRATPRGVEVHAGFTPRDASIVAIIHTDHTTRPAVPSTQNP